MLEKTIKVIHFNRKPRCENYSIERLFSDIRAAMPSDIDVTVRISSYLSNGLWRRIFNIIEATFRQGEVNHITGDVHFLTYLLSHKRTVLTIHDCTNLERLRGFNRAFFWFFWYWLPVRCSGVVTVISESSKRELLRFVNCDQNKLYVIYDCIPDWFVANIREFNTSCPIVLQVGTALNKNVERVALALKNIRCSWVIIGHLTEAQHSLIKSRGIHYTNLFGLSNDALLEQYRLADILVFASTSEGFGLPIIEANAVGRPVVTSSISSMPEVAGDAACLVDPYDVESIRAGIIRVIDDPDYRQHLVNAGFRNAERFRPATIAEQYATLYRKIAGKAKPK